MWIIDQFATNIDESKLGMNKKKSLIDLSCDDCLKNYIQFIFIKTRGSQQG